MSEETTRIEQLERQVAHLTAKIDYIAAQLGYINTDPGVPGQRQIPSDPRRTETGMGPLLSPTTSNFV